MSRDRLRKEFSADRALGIESTTGGNV